MAWWRADRWRCRRAHVRGRVTTWKQLSEAAKGVAPSLSHTHTMPACRAIPLGRVLVSLYEWAWWYLSMRLGGVGALLVPTCCSPPFNSARARLKYMPRWGPSELPATQIKTPYILQTVLYHSTVPLSCSCVQSRHHSLLALTGNSKCLACYELDSSSGGLWHGSMRSSTTGCFSCTK
jgi:hypothetical protein